MKDLNDKQLNAILKSKFKECEEKSNILISKIQGCDVEIDYNLVKVKHRDKVKEYNIDLVTYDKIRETCLPKVKFKDLTKKEKIHSIVNEFTDFLYQANPNLYSTISPDTIKDVVDEIIDVLLED